MINYYKLLNVLFDRGQKKMAFLLLFLLFSVIKMNAQVTVTGCTGAGNGSYTTLSQAATAIVAAQPSAVITISISGDTTEPAAGAVFVAGTWTSLTIVPTGGAARTISGAATAGAPLISFDGSDNVTINGLNSGGNSLTISNTTVSATSGTATIRFQNDATSNTVTNCTILGSSTSATGTTGGNIVFGSGAVTTGNDNNIVSNCNLGPAGSNLPSKLIFFSGTSNTDPGTANSGISITNNNLFDYFGAAVSSAAIDVNSGTTNISITNNKFYQTATRTQTTGANHNAIRLNNSSGNNYTVTGNTIGFSSSAGTGTYNFVGVSSSSVLIPIFVSIGTTTASNINGNTISGIAMSGAVSGTSSSASFRGIYVSAGLAICNNNNIGSQTVNGSISFTSSSASAADVIGIFNFGSNNWVTNNNTVGGITASNSSTGAANVYGIRCNTSSTVTWTCNNNTIGGSVANSLSSTSTATGSIVQGILNSNPIGTFTDNIIRNLTAAGGTGTTTSASVVGICSNSTANQTIGTNTIFNLSNTNTTAATVVTGIQFNGSTANIVERNLIYGLTSSTNSTSAEVNGIRVAGGTTIYRNNMIALGAGISNAIGSTASNAGTTGINGFNGALGTDSFFHNTIYIGGTATAGSGASFAFNGVQTTNLRSFRDNIFVNDRANSGATGKNYSIKINGTTANPTGLTINNNIYYGSGSAYVFGFFNSADVANLAAWKIAVGQDAGSSSNNPQLVNPTSSTPDLHISPTLASSAEATGADVSVVLDFDGQTRSGLTPVDIGADAGNFIPLPICSGLPASSTINGVASVCSGTGATLSLSSSYNDLGIVYQWKSSATSGGPYTNLGTGASQPTGNLTATTYYVCDITCTNSSQTFTTAAKVITVNALPTVGVTPTSGTFCNPGGTPIALNATGASTYSWSGTNAGLSATTGSSVTSTPTASTTVTVTGTDANGCTNTANASITVSSAVTVGTVTATPSTICPGGTTQLLATGTSAANYNVAAISSPVLETPGAATVTTLSGATGFPYNTAGTIGDDSYTNAIALPFSFNFIGSSVTQLWVSSNGYLTFSDPIAVGASAQRAPQTLPSATTPNSVIALFWHDMDIRTLGNVKYYTTGTAPNRKFIIEFNGIPTFAASTSLHSGQVVLNETSNTIQTYVSVSASATKTLGIENSTGTGGVSPSGRNNASWAVSSLEGWQFTLPTYTFSWTPTTNLSNATIANPVATGVPSTTTYSVTASLGGCTSPASNVTVTIDTLVGQAATNTSPVCAGTSFSVTANHTGGGAPYTYLWNDGVTATVYANTKTITANLPAGNYTFDCLVTDSCGSTVHSQVPVTVGATPTAAVTPSAAAICSPGTTSVSLVASGGTTYAWSPSTGLSAANVASVTANPSATTLYTVNVTGSNGCSASTTVNVFVGQTPTVSVDQSSVSICTGGSATLSVSSGALPSLTSVLSSINANSASLTASVPTPSGFTDGVTGNSILDGCNDMFDTGNLLNTNLASGIAYSDNVVTNNAAAFGTGGRYFTRVIGTNTCNTSSATIFYWAADINGLSTVSITGNLGADGTSGSQDLNTFTVSSGGVTYSCYYKRVFGAGDPSVNHLFMIPQATTATQTMGASNDDDLHQLSNLTGVTRVYYMLFAGAAGAQISIPAATSIAQTFANTITPTYAYNWSNGATTASTTVSPSSDTTYTVTASLGSCTSAPATVNVIVGATLVGQAATYTNACPSTNFTVTANHIGGGGPFNYSWSDGSSTVYPNSKTITANLPAGTYTFTCNITDFCGGSTVSSVTITINPVATVSPTTASVCGSQILTAATAGASPSFVWKRNGATISGATAATYTATEQGTYSVTVTETPGGCSSSATSTVFIKANPSAVDMTPVSASVCIGDNVSLSASATNNNTTVLREDFNGTVNGWTTVNNSTGGTPANAAWSLFISGTTIASNDNSNFVLSNSDAQGSGSTTSTILKSPVMDLSSYSNASLSFYQYFNFNASPDIAKVEVSTNNTTWTTLASYTSDQGAALAWAATTLDLSAYTGTGKTTVYVRFTYDAAWGFYWGIDNVLVTGTSLPSITWSPSTDLYSSLSPLTSYSGQSTAGVYSVPTQTRTYTATATSANGCFTSNTVTVTNKNLPAFTVSNAALCSDNAIGAVVTPTNADTGNSYVWSPTAGLTGGNIALDGTSTNSDIIHATPTSTTTYSVTANNNTTGCSSAPQTFTVTVSPQAVVTASTLVRTKSPNTTTTFVVTATNAVAYQWQVDSGSGFVDINGSYSPLYGESYSNATTAILTIDNIALEMNGYLFRCKVKGAGSDCGFVTPDNTFVGTLNVLDVGFVANLPADVSLCESGTADFSIQTTGGTPDNYAWQMSTNNGAFVTISDGVDAASGFTFAGTTTTDLEVTNITYSATDTYRFRCTLNDESIESDFASLNINKSITSTQEPEANKSLCSLGASATFTAKATGTISAVQWEYSTTGTGGWSSVANQTPANVTYSSSLSTAATLNGERTASLVITTDANTPASAGTYFYRAIFQRASEVCTDYNTGIGQLDITAPVLTSQPVSASVIITNSQTFSVGIADAGATYQWQYSTSPSSGFVNIPTASQTGATYSGATAATLTVTTSGTTPIVATNYYRVKVTSNGCVVYSNAAQLTVTNYCAPTYANGPGSTDQITRVVLGTLTNNSTASTSPFYTFFTGVTIPNLIKLSTNTVAVTMGSNATQFAAVWIDFNNNGTFEASEGVVGTTSAGANGTSSLSITVPATASLGQTRMRVRGGDNAALLATQACGASNSVVGETEDYLVNIIATPPPTITSYGAASACADGIITINGTNLYGVAASGVTINGTPVSSIVSNNGSVLVANIGSGSTSGAVSVTAAGGSVIGSSFTVNQLPAGVTVTGGGNICGATTTTLVASNGGDGTMYYQGTTTNGTSTTTASSSQAVTIAGTYYFRAQSVDGCWGPQGSSTVAFFATPPAPTTTNYNVCQGGTIVSGQGITSTSVGGTLTGTQTIAFNVSAQPVETQSTPGNVVASATMAALPAGSTVTGISISYPGLTALGSSWRADIRLGLSGALVNAAAIGDGPAPNSAGTFNYIRTTSTGITSTITGGTVNLLYWDNVSDNTGVEATFPTGTAVASVTVTYAYPNPNAVNWYTSSTGGTSIGTGSPFNPIGVANSGLADTNTVGTYSFYAEVNNGNCASTRTLANVVVAPVGFTSSSINVAETSGTANNDGTICTGAPVVLTASSTGGGGILTYEWKVGSTIVSTAASFTITPALTATTTYDLKITDSCGQIATVSRTITVNPLPTVAITSNPATARICGSGSVSMTATGASTYVWTPTTALVPATGTSNTEVSSATSTTVYSVVGTDANGCLSAATTQTVTVGPAVTMGTVSATPSIICTGSTSALSATASTSLVSNYTVTSITPSPETPTGTPVVLATGGVEGGTPARGGNSLDDGYWDGIALPFSFNFYSGTYNSVRISTNGNIQFGPVTTTGGNPGSSSWTPQTIPTAGGNLDNFIGGAWMDQDVSSGTFGTIRYFVNGTAPNRKFVISYEACKVFNSTDQNTSQIILNENGTVDVLLLGNGLVATTTKAIGMENAGGTKGAFAPGRNSGTWTTAANEAWRFTPQPLPLDYTWTGSNAFSSAVQNPTTPVLTANATYNVTATEPVSGCFATGSTSVTVNPNNTVALTSATGTNTQTVFVGSPITTITYATTGATGATFAGLPAGVTGSWAANVITISGSPNVTGTFNYTATLTGGCGNVTATGTITSSALLNWYLDADGDHYYTGTAIVTGPSPGPGYTTTVIGGGDCNDSNPAINPGAAEICYNNIDDNCSGTLSEGCAPVVVNMTPSYNNTTLPSLATAVPAVPYTYGGFTNLKYRFRITNITAVPPLAPVEVIQTSRYVTIPASLHSYNAQYTITASAVINDEVVPYAGNTITVNSPTVQLITLNSATCGATLATLASTLTANAGLNATGYTFRIRLNDSNPTPTYAYSQSATRFVSANSFTGFPLQYSTSYKVAVQYTFTDPVTNLPVDSGYGAECTVNTPSIPLTSLASPTCGSTVAAMNANISASAAPYATGYQFRIRLFADNGPTPTYYYTPVIASRFSSLTAFQGITLAYSTAYSISVQYSVLNGSTTVWSGYGSECKVTTPFFPTTSLVPTQCGLLTPTSLTQQLNITPYPGFPNYKVKLDEVSGEDIVNSQEIVITYSYFRLNQFSIAQAGKNYNVSVAIKLNGVFGDYSTACDLFTAPLAKTNATVPFKATAYPNPFANNFMLDVKTTSQSSVNLKVYDMIGRLIEQRDVRVSDMETTTIGDNYPSGVYNVVVSQEESVQTVRVVKR